MILRYRHTAFTLVEMLAVIALVSLAFGLLATGFSASTDRARLDASASQILDLDRRARILAQRSARVALRFDASIARSVVLEVGGEGVGRVSLQADASVEARTDDDTLDVVRFDRLGRSVDYSVLIGSAGGQRRFDVSGLTGWVVAIREGSL